MTEAPKKTRRAPALTPRIFAVQYEALLFQSMRKPVDLTITDEGEDEVTDAFQELLKKGNWTKEDCLRASSLTFTMAVMADITGEDYEEDDEDEEGDGG